ncbi:hypothetical protein EDB83DRAFT_2532592 [Lactarius deliciosus]|nr:hypothetical protein EDB83DRAFT_2532592 [Lactarius deliciosus]
MVPLLICKLICSLVTGLLGFHTYGYAHHFLSSCTHILSFPIIPDGVEFEGRLALVARAFPNGIDFFTRCFSVEPSAPRAPTAITEAAAMGGVLHTTTITDREDRYDNDYDSRENETASMIITIAIAATLRAVGQCSTELHPLPTTTPPPPLTKLGRFLVHTILPTRNVVPHRRPDGHLALLPRQDHPPHGHGAERTTPRTQTGRPTREPHLSTPPAKALLEAWIGATNAPRPSLTRSATHRRLAHYPRACSKSCNPMRPARAPRHSDGPYAAGNHSFLSNNVPRDRHGHVAHNPGPLSLDESGSDFEDDAADDNDNHTATTATATMVASGSGDDSGEGKRSHNGGLHGGDS